MVTLLSSNKSNSHLIQINRGRTDVCLQPNQNQTAIYGESVENKVKPTEVKFKSIEMTRKSHEDQFIFQLTYNHDELKTKAKLIELRSQNTCEMDFTIKLQTIEHLRKIYLNLIKIN